MLGEADAQEGVEITPGEIREGATLMFYPEMNVLMKAMIDPRCGTPGFKRVPLQVRGPLAGGR